VCVGRGGVLDSRSYALGREKIRLNAFEDRNVVKDMRSSLLVSAATLTVSILYPAFCQTTTAPALPTFEAVSVKPSKQTRGRGTVQFGLVASNVTIKQLVQQAYELQAAQILGPDWISTERYNVTAHPTEPAGTAELRLLLQKLLEEHFKLKARRETRELPVYWLTVAEGGPKLADPSQERAFNAAAREKSPFRPGFDAIFRPGDVAGFAKRLSRMLGRPVLDKTGIQGRFWFQLEWVPDQPGSAGPSMRAALEEQLGLKLVEKSAPTEVLVIDAVERP
jgi:uncharacterized protein (TIGR03435 family)